MTLRKKELIDFSVLVHLSIRMTIIVLNKNDTIYADRYTIIPLSYNGIIICEKKINKLIQIIYVMGNVIPTIHILKYD